MNYSFLYEWARALWRWFWPPADDWRWYRATPPEPTWLPLIMETRPEYKENNPR
jgi:hypothetical protein